MGGECSKKGGGKDGPKRSKETSLAKKIGESGVKIVILGEMSTGKTCMVLRLVQNQFSDHKEPTIGYVTHPPNKQRGLTSDTTQTERRFLCTR